MSLHSLELSPIEVRERLEKILQDPDVSAMVSALKWAEKEILKRDKLIEDIDEIIPDIEQGALSGFPSENIFKLRTLLNNYESDKEPSKRPEAGCDSEPEDLG